MLPPPIMSRLIRFGTFAVDPKSRELFKQGMQIMLQAQPFQVLSLLLEHRGDIVTREELRKALWPRETFVDFDQGLNKAINKLRKALGDSAESPRYIETLNRCGYRVSPSDCSYHRDKTMLSSKVAEIRCNRPQGAEPNHVGALGVTYGN